MKQTEANNFFVARQHTQRDIVLANPSVCPSTFDAHPASVKPKAKRTDITSNFFDIPLGAYFQCFESQRRHKIPMVTP